MTANEAMRPYRVWRHDLGTTEGDDTLVFEETDERFYVTLEPQPQPRVDHHRQPLRRRSARCC